MRTPNFGRIDYTQHSWLSGEYDPNNSYPLDDRGKEYVKSFENLEKKGIWFICAFVNEYKTNSYGGRERVGYTSNRMNDEWCFVDNYGNVWIQRVKDGLRMCPLKERSYTQSTTPLSDYDIGDIVNKQWWLPHDDQKVTDHIRACIVEAETENTFDRKTFIKPLKGCKLPRPLWVNLKTRYIIAPIGIELMTGSGRLNTQHYIDNYGTLWTESGIHASPVGTWPLQECQRGSLECLCEMVKVLHDYDNGWIVGSATIATALQTQTQELYKLQSGSPYSLIPRISHEHFDAYQTEKKYLNESLEESYPIGTRQPFEVIDNKGRVWTIGEYRTFDEYTPTGTTPCPGHGDFTYPLCSIHMPIIEVIQKSPTNARDRFCGAPRRPNTHQMNSVLLKLQPEAKYFFKTYASSSIRRQKLHQFAELQHHKDETDRKLMEETKQKNELERLKAEEDLRIKKEQEAQELKKIQLKQEAEIALLECQRETAEAQKKLQEAQSRLLQLNQ